MKYLKILYWAPRILGILYILFLAIFALDVFIPGETMSFYLIALFMHLIPNFVLLVLLLISWRNEKSGALLFAVSFTVLLFMFWDKNAFVMQLLLFSPLLIISLLFFIYTKYNNERP